MKPKKKELSANLLTISDYNCVLPVLSESMGQTTLGHSSVSCKFKVKVRNEKENRETRNFNLLTIVS